MGIIPDRYFADFARSLRKNIRKTGGWLALSPLLVFLVVYLVSSLLARDFYKIPITAAFLVASVYALLISKGGTDEKIAAYSQGAGDKSVLLAHIGEQPEVTVTWFQPDKKKDVFQKSLSQASRLRKNAKHRM